VRLKRTHTCGQLRAADAGKDVVLAGWVQHWRDHGGVGFIDLRDRYGLTQIVFHPDRGADLHERSRQLRSEYVVAVKGLVQPRPEGTVNPKLATGEIEVAVTDLELLNTAETPPFEVADDTEAAPELRMKYRYIDLRRPRMQRNLRVRHRAAKLIRDYYDAHDFLEIETPMLTKSTPEGARDYLVPSRLYPGSFYALPQSPQLFKQILMVGGCDRYAQIVRCFRDEDLRGNRQPEFTQLDVEMSFVDEEDVFAMTEGLMQVLFKDLLGRHLALPLRRMPYDEALRRYASDKPDLRFGLEIEDVGDLVGKSGFKVFADTVAAGGCVRGFRAPGAAERYSRKDLDGLTAFVGEYGAKGLAWFKMAGGALTSPIAKFFDQPTQAALIQRLAAQNGDLLLFVADKEEMVVRALGPLRVRLGHELGLVRPDDFQLLWVVDFPLFGWDSEANRLDPQHHPFTSPRLADLDRLEAEPLKVKARAYDLVLNGEEIAGGSIRIHQEAVQERIFRLLKIGPEEARVRFGFFLDALKYGAPPHGGIAFGFDRLVSLFCGEEAIREVIPFPKTQRAVCQLTSAPTPVDEAQLKELGLRLL
jgi:aspartyl-tRNA synthetase